MTDLVALKQANARRWANARVTRNFVSIAKSLVAARFRYQMVEANTGVPWFIIAVIHEREASQNWNTQLGQGDPLNRVSVHVPSGRGPFKSWEDSAVDSLVNCAPHASRNKDWSAGGSLTLLETYNGLGYAARGAPSPYLWSGTDQYRSGKYVRDGVYDSTAVDRQLGCAGLLLAMIALDPTITFPDTAITPPSPASATSRSAAHELPKPPPPSIAHPSKGSVGALIASILSTIFNRRRKRP